MGVGSQESWEEYVEKKEMDKVVEEQIEEVKGTMLVPPSEPEEAKTTETEEKKSCCGHCRCQ